MSAPRRCDPKLTFRKVGYNWKYGRCTVKTLKGHTNGVTCLQLDDHILATGSYDATIKICTCSGAFRPSGR